MPNATPPVHLRRTGSLTHAGAAAACAAIAIAAVGTFPEAHAATEYNPLEPALGFNAFVEDETLLSSTEPEGGIATGGNLVLGTYNVNIHDASTFTAPGDTVPSSLVVGGRIDFSQSQAGSVVQVHDHVKVGDLTGTDVLYVDSNFASVNTRLVVAGADYNSTPRIELDLQQPLASVGSTSPIDFDAAFTELRANAADLYACEAHEVAMEDDQAQTIPKGGVAQGQQVRISLDEGFTNVLNVTGEDLNNMADMVFVDQPTADTPLLINVDTSGAGGEMGWDVKNQTAVSGNEAPYILWNFNDTTRLRLTGATVEGSILAPDADYSDISSSNVEGQIIATNVNLGEVGQSGGEIHNFPFAGTLTCEDDVEPASSEPTDAPTTWDSTTSGGGGGADETTGGWDDGSAESGGDALDTTGNGLGAFVIGAASLVTVGAVALFSSRRKRTDEPD
jgi:choice-of-anchor A domain-containing protein